MKAGEGDLYAGGVKSLLYLKDGKLVVGAGDGTVELIEIIDIKNSKEKRPRKPSKFPNTPQIFTVSRLNLLVLDSSARKRHSFVIETKERKKEEKKEDTQIIVTREVESSDTTCAHTA